MDEVLLIGRVRACREALARVLGEREALAVADAASAADAVRGRGSLRDAVAVLIDFSVAEGRVEVQALLETDSDARVVALGVSVDAWEVLAWSEAGVLSVLERETSLPELAEAIRQARAGLFTSSHALASVFLEDVAVSGGEERRGLHRVRRLTARENEVVDLAGRGLSNKEIATALNLELATVKNHLYSAFRKLGTHRRAEAAAIARHRRLRR